MRYVYIKYGNAVEQVRRLAVHGTPGGSGPEAFIEQFLRARAGDDVLILCRGDRSEIFEAEGLRAESVPARGPMFGGVIGRAWSAIRIGGKIMRLRSDRMRVRR
jgi:hypothetical protein